jgi:uncharacterized membrane protein YkvA (DUF1232 family)
MWWQLLLGVVAGLLLLYASLLVVLWRANRDASDPTRLRDVLRLLPDVIRLLRRLAADPEVPRGVRIRLLLLTAYLISPLDLIPDFVPVLGYADDAIVVAIALRSVIRHAGYEPISRHWPGSPEGLTVVERLVGKRP